MPGARPRRSAAPAPGRHDPRRAGARPDDRAHAGERALAEHDVARAPEDLGGAPRHAVGADRGAAPRGEGRAGPRGDPHAGRRRDGPGLPRAAALAGPGGRGQDGARRGVGARARGAPGGGRDHRAPRASRGHPGARAGHRPRRATGPRDEARRGRGLERAAGEPPARGVARRRAGRGNPAPPSPRDPHAGVQRGVVRAQPRHHPPGHQARERAHRTLWRDLPRGLGHRPPDRGRPARDADVRDPVVHGSGAGRGRRHRRAHGRLPPRRDAPPRPDGSLEARGDHLPGRALRRVCVGARRVPVVGSGAARRARQRGHGARPGEAPVQRGRGAARHRGLPPEPELHRPRRVSRGAPREARGSSWRTAP